MREFVALIILLAMCSCTKSAKIGKYIYLDGFNTFHTDKMCCKNNTTKHKGDEENEFRQLMGVRFVDTSTIHRSDFEEGAYPYRVCPKCFTDDAYEELIKIATDNDHRERKSSEQSSAESEYIDKYQLTIDGKVHEVSVDNIKKYGWDRYAADYPGATVRMRDHEGDYDVPLGEAQRMIDEEGLHPYVVRYIHLIYKYMTLKALEDEINSRRITKAEVAERANITRRTLDSILLGSDTKVSTLESLAKALRKPISIFFPDDPYLENGGINVEVEANGKESQATLFGDNNKGALTDLQNRVKSLEKIIALYERIHPDLKDIM